MSEFSAIGLCVLAGCALVMLYGIWTELEHIRRILDERNRIAQDVESRRRMRDIE